jgi:hypothetical protein
VGVACVRFVGFCSPNGLGEGERDVRFMKKIALSGVCVVFAAAMLLSGSASAIIIDALSLSELEALIPTDVVGDGADAPVIGNGVQGVDGQPFWADANGVVSDGDDEIIVGETFDIILGPCTDNDDNYNPKAGEPLATPDIDALLMTVTFDVSGGEALLPVTLSGDGASDTLNAGNFDYLSDLGFAPGGGGDSFNPAADDLVGAFLITDVDFNAGDGTDIGDFVLDVTGWTEDYMNLYRIDLFGVDQSYEYTSPAGGGEIISGASNSAGGYLVPEPGSLVVIGGVLLGLACKRRR